MKTPPDSPQNFPFIALETNCTKVNGEKWNMFSLNDINTKIHGFWSLVT